MKEKLTWEWLMKTAVRRDLEHGRRDIRGADRPGGEKDLEGAAA